MGVISKIRLELVVLIFAVILSIAVSFIFFDISDIIGKFSSNTHTLNTEITTYNDSIRPNLHPYENIIIKSDTLALNDTYEELYIPIIKLVKIIEKVKDNAIVTNLTNESLARILDKSGKHGLLKGTDQPAREILAKIRTNFSKKCLIWS